MARGINENTDLQAASPAIEINRLYDLMGAGESALRMIALLIIIVSGLSIFISLYNALKERKYELAIMRTMGAYQSQMLWMILLEGLFMAVVGFVLGWLIGHVGMELMSDILEEEYNYRFTGWVFEQHHHEKRYRPFYIHLFSIFCFCTRRYLAATFQDHL